MSLIRLIAILVATLFVAAPAIAGDWVVTRLRGTVEQRVDEAWVSLKRGDSIEYDRDVRTLSDGHAELQRNLEVLTLDVNTTIRIQHDIETGFTTVLQEFGRLEVDADIRNVKHFAVQTAYLAAVVKGTRFVVTTDLDGTTVAVDRGAVGVTSVASERSTTITVGQSATVEKKKDLTVGGLGPWPPILEKEAAPVQSAALAGTASAGNATAQLPAPEAANDPSPMQIAAAPATQIGGGTVGDLLGGTNQVVATQAEPASPVSPTVVMIGVLIGAALGALALFFRRIVR
jgi:hypothetical protein